ncbi:MAG: hypothetical protein ACLFMT_03685 [Halobacteriales archaeon]
MEKTDAGTSLGVEDPYAHVDSCDYLAEDNLCRLFREDDVDAVLSEALDDSEGRCPVAGDPDVDGLSGDWNWSDCASFRCRRHTRRCRRCGLEERRMPGERPLLEEHHLSYPDDGHEITVYLCRWCHTRVHRGWAALEDDVEPSVDALAERERRRSREVHEGFSRASEYVEDD